MGLFITEPPTGITEGACLHLGRLKSGTGLQTRGMLAECTREQLWLAAPHPVFNLRIDEIHPTASFEAVQMTGWRYIALSRGLAVATLEMASGSRTGVARFCRITDGRMAASVVRAISKAERNTTVSHRRYSLGMVRVPSLHAHAIWLRDGQADGVHDLFAVVTPVPPSLPKERLLTAHQFMNALSRLKQRAARTFGSSR